MLVLANSTHSQWWTMQQQPALHGPDQIEHDEEERSAENTPHHWRPQPRWHSSCRKTEPEQYETQ